MSTVSLPIDQLVGKTLGNYHLKQLLGHGRLSALYLAEEQAQNRAVMLTVLILPEEYVGEPRDRFMVRFTQEAAALVRLKHPSIIPIDDYGVQLGYPYLVTPFVDEGSLAKGLKQHNRYTPVQTLEILRQLAAGLDYVHDNGVVHGMLKPANVLLSSQQAVHITGFGLQRMLAMVGVTAVNHPQSHLLSIAGTFLGSPEYIAPEVVEGATVDARSDVYSLGIMLFELLTGTLPFTGTDPFAVAAQRLYQQVPALQTVCPDVPAGLDLVIQRALERDPAQRFQSAGKLAMAFARVLKVVEGVGETTAPSYSTTAAATHITPVQPLVAIPGAEAMKPSDNNWFDAEVAANGKWHLMSLEATGYVPVTPTDQLARKPAIAPMSPSDEESGSWQISPPIVTAEMRAIKFKATSGPLQFPNGPFAPLTNFPGDVVASSAKASKQLSTGQLGEMKAQKAGEPGKAALETEIREEVDETKRNTKPRVAAVKAPKKPKASKKRATPSRSRRKVVMLATGSVVTVGILGAGGVGLAHFMPNMVPNLQNLQKIIKQVLPASATPQNKNAPQNKVTPQSSATPQHNATPPGTKGQTQNMPPAPGATKPAQAGHVGTVVGGTNQGVNTAKSFSNPADGKGSLLVRLPNGNFAAYESACTHQGVTVNYDATMHKFVCPLHGSIFDPANNGAVVRGPATAPLPQVQIHVNADGTITAG